MKLDQLEGIIPNRRACFDLMCLLENEYNCSLRMWLDANNPRGGEIGWFVYCSGSGHIWDHDDLEHFAAKARVLDADGGSLYKAVWSCLLQLESRFRRLARASDFEKPPFALKRDNELELWAASDRFGTG